MSKSRDKYFIIAVFCFVFGSVSSNAENAVEFIDIPEELFTDDKETTQENLQSWVKHYFDNNRIQQNGISTENPGDEDGYVTFRRKLLQIHEGHKPISDGVSGGGSVVDQWKVNGERDGMTPLINTSSIANKQEIVDNNNNKVDSEKETYDKNENVEPKFLEFLREPITCPKGTRLNKNGDCRKLF